MKEAALPRGRIRAVFFDVQGTLVDREGGWKAAFAEALGEFAGRWEKGDFSPEDAADRYAAALRSGDGARSGGGARRSRSAGSSRSLRMSKRRHLAAMKAALAGSPFDVTPSFLASLYRRTKALASRHPVAAPGAGDVLGRLSRRYRLGIISNSPRERVMQLLSGAGLDGHFDDGSVFVPAGRGQGKPGKRIFRTALAAFRIKPGQAVMVGDSWRKDVLGARRLGMHAVHVRPGRAGTGSRKARLLKRRPAVVRIAGLRQLLRLLDI